MDEIIQMLEKEEKERLLRNIDIKEELSFLEDFLSEIDIKDYNSIVNMDRKKFLFASLCTAEVRPSYRKIKELYEKFPSLLDKKNSDNFFYLMNLIDKFNEAGILTDIAKIPLLEDSDSFFDEIVPIYSQEFQRINQAELSDMFSMMNALFKKAFSFTNENKDTFFELLSYFKSSYKEAFNYIIVLIFQEKCIEKAIKDGMEEKRINKATMKMLEKENVLSMIKKIKKRKEILCREKEQKERGEISRKGKHASLISDIASLNNLPVIRLNNSILSRVKNEQIKFSLLKRSIERNVAFYQKRKTSTLEAIFANSPFNFRYLSEKDKELLQKFKNPSSLQEVMELFNDQSLSFLSERTFPIVDVLLLSNASIISSISKFIKQGLITENFIFNNPNIFVNKIPLDLKDKVSIQDGAYSTLSSNIAELRGVKANVGSLSENAPSILLMDNDKLQDSLCFLKGYGLNYSKGECLEVLSDPALVKYLDNFIELGLSDFIKENPDIINSQSEKLINRIILMKQLNIPIFNKGKLSSDILENGVRIGKAVMHDDEIGECIVNSVFKYADESLFNILNSSSQTTQTYQEIDSLLPFKKDDNVYDINGVEISRNKALRNYSILKNNVSDVAEEKIVFNALVYGSILDDDKLDTISSSISPTPNKQKKYI